MTMGPRQANGSLKRVDDNEGSKSDGDPTGQIAGKNTRQTVFLY